MLLAAHLLLRRVVLVLLFSAILACAPRMAAAQAEAPFLSVDFDLDATGETQVDFEPFRSGFGNSRDFLTSEGTVTVAHNATFYDTDLLEDETPPGFTYANLYNDLVYVNNGAIQVRISGLVPGRSYEITWYSFQPHPTPLSVTGQIAAPPLSATANTTGSVLPYSYDLIDWPSSNERYAYTGVWTSPDGSLEIDISGNVPRLNGFRISHMPECQTDADCEAQDGNAFCNGSSTCDAQRDCQPGTPPCVALCSESMDTCAPPLAAPFLSVDFENAVDTQPGFQSFAAVDGTSKPFATTEGMITVSHGGVFYESNLLEDVSPFTYSKLYDDFIYNQAYFIPMEISGLVPGGRYEITWYSFQRNLAYPDVPANDVVNRLESSPTATSTGDVVYTRFNLGHEPRVRSTHNYQFAATGEWTAGSDGEIAIRATADETSPQAGIVRINGFQIARLPECATDADCDFCNGETCDGSHHCEPATAPVCAPSQYCDELANECLGAALTPLLNVDFDSQSSPNTESDFRSFTGLDSGNGTQVFPEVGVVVSVSGAEGAASRGLLEPQTTPLARLYDDFIYRNNSQRLQFTIAGLQMHQPYQLTWYAYDAHAYPGPESAVRNRVRPTPGSNTVGSDIEVAFNTGNHPTAAGQYAFSGVWTSTDASLEIDVHDAFGGGGYIRVNGLQIARVVECTLDVQCDDGLYCNGSESCVSEQCTAGVPPNPDDGVGCTVDTCNEADDVLVHTSDPAACQDDLFCNGHETCDPLLGCGPGSEPCFVPVLCDEDQDLCAACSSSAQCSDGQYCNGPEVCTSGSCSFGSSPSLDDGVACTSDSCDEVNDTPVHEANDALCANGVFCDGAEVCNAVAGCQAGSPPLLDDGIACTLDDCDEDLDQVLHQPDDAVCSNGLYCDGTETCDPEFGCDPGSAPCQVGCDETGDVCLAGAVWVSPDVGVLSVRDDDLALLFVERVEIPDLPDAADLSGYHREVSGEALLSFDAAVNLPGGIVAGPADIVRRATSGTFELAFDASAQGIPDGARIDAIATVSDGIGPHDLLVSFDRTVSWCGLVSRDEDLIRVSVAESSPCELFFDGSEEGIPAELDLDGAHYREGDEVLMLSFDRGACVQAVCFSDDRVVEFALAGSEWGAPALGAGPPQFAARSWESADADAIALPEANSVLMLCAGAALLAALRRQRFRR